MTVNPRVFRGYLTLHEHRFHQQGQPRHKTERSFGLGGVEGEESLKSSSCVSSLFFSLFKSPRSSHPRGLRVFLFFLLLALFGIGGVFFLHFDYVSRIHELTTALSERSSSSSAPVTDREEKNLLIGVHTSLLQKEKHDGLSAEQKKEKEEERLYERKGAQRERTEEDNLSSSSSRGSVSVDQVEKEEEEEEEERESDRNEDDREEDLWIEKDGETDGENRKKEGIDSSINQKNAYQTHIWRKRASSTFKQMDGGTWDFTTALSLVDLKDHITRLKRESEKRRKENMQREGKEEEEEEPRSLHTHGVAVVLLLPDDTSLTSSAVHTLQALLDVRNACPMRKLFPIIVSQAGTSAWSSSVVGSFCVGPLGAYHMQMKKKKRKKMKKRRSTRSSDTDLLFSSSSLSAFSRNEKEEEEQETKGEKDTNINKKEEEEAEKDGRRKSKHTQQELEEKEEEMRDLLEWSARQVFEGIQLPFSIFLEPHLE
ncbi:alpha- -mannosyl-glycoprotein 2-beta-n-acetylglucosaminyltransferase, partial [Cystoisospora suis]